MLGGDAVVQYPGGREGLPSWDGPKKMEPRVHPAAARPTGQRPKRPACSPKRGGHTSVMLVPLRLYLPLEPPKQDKLDPPVLRPFPNLKSSQIFELKKMAKCNKKAAIK